MELVRQARSLQRYRLSVDNAAHLRLAEASVLSPRKANILDHANRFAISRADWRKKAAFFHREDERYLRFLIPPGSRVLEIGCGIGDTLAVLKPSYGVGIEFSPAQIDVARQRHPDLLFVEGDAENAATLSRIEGPFDFILVLDTIGSVDDCQQFLSQLHLLCMRETRLVIGYFSHLWYPALKIAELLRWRMPQPDQNVLSPADLCNLARLADFDPVKTEQRVLLPVFIFGVGRFLNKFVSVLPGIRALSLRHYLVVSQAVV